MPSTTDIPPLCKRCRVNAAQLVVRAESLCSSCFTAYIRTKTVKRIETYRIKHFYSDIPRNIVLPISFGASSIALLDTVSNYLSLQTQRKGRPNYRLYVVHVLHTGSTLSPTQKAIFARLQTQYPEHTYSCISLSSIYLHNDAPLPVFKQLGLHSDDTVMCEVEPTLLQMSKLLQNIASTTSRADIVSLLLTRIILRFAKQSQCDGIFWGDSTTRLAEKIISESAKGRGYALPWLVTDGDTPHGIAFYFPLRDVLKKELLDFVTLTTPPLRHLVSEDSFVPAQAPVSSKLTTIDMLMKQYFESVEESYPGIVSNVVRTSSKLQPSAIGLKRCKLCKLPVTPEQLGIENWEGIQETTATASPSQVGLCYGCSRTVPAVAIALLPG